MKHEEALELAREVINGKSRSYVSAAISLAKYLIEREAPAPSTLAPPERAGTPPLAPKHGYSMGEGGPMVGPARGRMNTPPAVFAEAGTSPAVPPRFSELGKMEMSQPGEASPTSLAPSSPCALAAGLGEKRSFTPLAGTPLTRPHDEDLDELGDQPLPVLGDSDPGSVDEG